MTNELLFSRGDSPGVIEALIAVIPAGWDLRDGKLEAPVSLIESGDAVAGFTLYINDRLDLHQQIAVSWDGTLEKAITVLGEWKRPGSVWITSRGNNAYFSLIQAWQIARPYIEMGYQGSLHFGHSHGSRRNLEWCALGFGTKEIAGGPPVIRIWWDAEEGDEKHASPIIAKCHELGLNQMYGKGL